MKFERRRRRRSAVVSESASEPVEYSYEGYIHTRESDVESVKILNISSAGSSTAVSNVEFWDEKWIDGVSLSINVPGQDKTEVVMDRDTVDWLMVELVKKRMEWS